MLNFNCLISLLQSPVPINSLLSSCSPGPGSSGDPRLCDDWELPTDSQKKRLISLFCLQDFQITAEYITSPSKHRKQTCAFSCLDQSTLNSTHTHTHTGTQYEMCRKRRPHLNKQQISTATQMSFDESVSQCLTAHCSGCFSKSSV